MTACSKEHLSNSDCNSPINTQQRSTLTNNSTSSKVLMPDVLNRSIYSPIKRILDFCFSLCGLLVLAVPFAILALAIYLDDPGKVIFSQYRIGFNGEPFKIYKLRTLTADTPSYLSSSELQNQRISTTRVGKVLRQLSIDELPQLVNVLKGDMSIIGPRPLIADESEIHTMRMQLGVYSVRPGITGLAQVNGRNTVSPSEKVYWDALYLAQFGFLKDLGIFFRTFFHIWNPNENMDS